jgi:hypothetical protein
MIFQSPNKYPIMRAVIIYIAILFLQWPLVAQEVNYRQAAWVHGFGGNYCTLKGLEEHFERYYEISSVRTEYSTQRGIAASGDEIRADLNRQFALGDQRNLGIGHSMGGLNLRYTEVGKDPTPMGGIITIGTPHEGSQLAENYLNGGLDNFVKEMTAELIAGPKSDMFASAFLYELNYKTDLPLIEILGKGSLGIEDLLGLFKKGNTLDFFETLLESQSTIEDLAPGSDALGQLNEIKSARTSAAIWGEEDSPVHWRLFSSLIDISCDQEPGVTNDEILLPKVERLKDLYKSLENMNKALCQIAYVFGTFGMGDKEDIPVCVTAGNYARGVRWVRGSEEGWKELIGATRKERHLVTKNEFICDHALKEATKNNDFEYASEILSNPDCYRTVKVWTDVWIKEPSDGLVTKTSAIALPGVNQTIKAAGANHFELVNHSETIAGIESLFEQYGTWFYTPRK